jgi:hypothetical protein
MNHINKKYRQVMNNQNSSYQRRGVRPAGRASSLWRAAMVAAIMLVPALQAVVAQNVGTIDQAINAAAPYHTVYFGIYPQTHNNLVLTAMANLPTPLYPTGPFKIVAEDEQELNGGAVPVGKNPRPQASIFNVEPLPWRIVKDDVEGVLLLTDGNVDIQAYDETGTSWSGKWSDATLRTWLQVHFLNGQSDADIPQVYRANLTSYNNGDNNDLIGVKFPYANLSPGTTYLTDAWSGGTATDYFAPYEKSAIVPSLLPNPTRNNDGDIDDVSTTDLVFVPAMDVVEAIYPTAADRNSVNTRYTMSFPNTTSAPAFDDWFTRSHSPAPFKGYVLQVTRVSGAEKSESAAGKKAIRPALHLNRDSVLMVSWSKPAVTNLLQGTTFASQTTPLTLTLIDGTIPAFGVTPGTVPDGNGYISVSAGTQLALNCTGGTAGGFVSCLLEDADGIKYYTRAAVWSGSPVPPVNLDFTGVTAGVYTLKVFNEVAGTNGQPDRASKPVVFNVIYGAPAITAPVINTAETLSSGFGLREYKDTVKLTAGTNPHFEIASGALPAGLTLNATTGVISGIIGAVTGTQNYAFEVKASNSAYSDTESFSIAVTEIIPPVITTTSLPTGYLTIPYSEQILHTGGQPSVKFSISDGTLPAGLTLEENGVLHGTPTTVQTETFKVRAETEGEYAYQTYTVSIQVTALNPGLPVFVTASLVTAQENVAYPETTIEITGSAYINVQYDPSTFPTGITFDPSTRKILGMPIQGSAGSYSLHLWAKNPATKPTDPAGPDSVGILLSLDVLAANVPMFTTPSSLPPAAKDIPYSEPIETTDPAATLAVSGLVPNGFTLDAQDNFTGTPTTAGTYTFQITATNADGSTQQNFTLDVQPPSPAPLIDPPAATLPEATVGVTYTGYTFTAVNNPSSWNWGAGVPGLSLSNTGVVSGTPTAPGTYPISVTASHAWGTSAPVTTSIVIQPSPLSIPPTIRRVLPDATSGEAYYREVFVFNRPDIVWTMTGSLPAGLTFTNGVISGTPSGMDASYEITVTASSAGNQFAPVSQTMTLWLISNLEIDHSRRVLLTPVSGATTEPEAGEYFVKSGGSFTFTVTSTTGHRVSPVVTTGRLSIPDATGISIVSNDNGGFYTVTVRDIREDVTITLSPSDNASVESDATRIWSVANYLYILTPSATDAKIYNVSGGLVKSVSLEAGRTAVTTLSPGIYIVELNDGVKGKVLVK